MAEYFLFPFGEIAPNEEIIIWGYGYAGRCYVEQLTLTNYCKLYAVVDRDNNRMNGIAQSPELILQHKDIKIVIAQGNPNVANEIISQLLLWGVERSNIIYRKLESSIMANTNHIWDDVNKYGKTINTKLDVLDKKANRLNEEAFHLDIKMEYIRRILTSIESDVRDGRGFGDERFINHIDAIKKTMVIKGIDENKLMRIGNPHDGGYVIARDLYGSSRIAYSFGISNDYSWDKAICNMGFEVYMYDHTIADPKNLDEGMHFYKIGICGREDSNVPDLKTMEHILASNGHLDSDGMILKMDVEGAEYDFLKEVDSGILAKFDQIIMEIHFITDTDFTETITSALRKLNSTHELVHVHGNNCSNIRYVKGQAISDSIEVLYVLKEKYSNQLNKVSSKRLIDQANDKDRIEVDVWEALANGDNK